MAIEKNINLCPVMDPEILEGEREDNVSVPSSFIANAQNELAHASGGFRGGPSRLQPPLGDGLTPSLTAMLANAKF